MSAAAAAPERGLAAAVEEALALSPTFGAGWTVVRVDLNEVIVEAANGHRFGLVVLDRSPPCRAFAGSAALSAELAALPMSERLGRLFARTGR